MITGLVPPRFPVVEACRDLDNCDWIRAALTVCRANWVGLALIDVLLDDDRFRRLLQDQGHGSDFHFRGPRTAGPIHPDGVGVRRPRFRSRRHSHRHGWRR